MIRNTFGSERADVSPAGLVCLMDRGPVADATGKDATPSGLCHTTSRNQ